MSVKDIVYIALMAALMAALGVFPPITIPALGVPITAQSMGPMLAGGILGARRGGLSMVLFLVLIAVGLPLLSGGRGGFGVFAGPGGGFILGWVVVAFAMGWLTEKFWDRLNVLYAVVCCIASGIVLLYVLGVPWVAVAAKIPLIKALTGSAVFIPGDIVKALVASGVIVSVKRAYPLIAQPA